MNEFHDEEVYPPVASAGGNNGYYLDNCTTAGHRPSYCVCLNKIMALERTGTLRGLMCEHEIRDSVCPALTMRQEEAAAGQALYYVNRTKLLAWHAEQDRLAAEGALAKRARNTPSASSPLPASPPASLPASSPAAPPLEQNGYAAAINRAIAATTSMETIKSVEAIKPVAAVKPPPVVQPAATAATAATAAIRSGMSLLEIARMQLAAKTS